MRASASTTSRSRTPPKAPRGVLILVVDGADADTLRVAVEAAGYRGRAEQLS